MSVLPYYLARRRFTSTTTLPITGIIVTNTSLDDNHVGSFATLFMVEGTEPPTFSIVSGPAWLSVVGDELYADGTQFAGTEDIVLKVVDGASNEYTSAPLAFTINEAYIPPETELPDDGDVVVTDPPTDPDDGFEGDVVETPTDEGLEVVAKNKGNAAFLKELTGHPLPGYTYTMLVDPDWSGMNQLGSGSALGFAFLADGLFHMIGLQGVNRNSQEVKVTKFYGDFSAPKNFTIETLQTASHGIKDGPNWYQFYWHPDNTQYTFRTGPFVDVEGDGTPYFIEVQGSTIDPIAALGAGAQFGPAGYFSNNDKGVAVIVFKRWIVTPGPTEMFLSNNDAERVDPSGTEVGTLTAMGGVPPYTFEFVD